MAKTINVSWVLPTTRVSGNPLDPADINGVEVHLDGGAGFVLATTVPPGDAQSWSFPDMVDGDYVIRLIVTSLFGDSVPVDTPVVIDDSGPNPVTDVVIDLV
jgi:hypothetical protein